MGGYGAFVAFNQDVSVTSPKPIASSSTVSVGYDLELFLCDTSSLELPTEAAVAPITPGTPIRFCISVADTETGVHVDTIQTVSYSSAAVGNEQTPQVIIDKGVALTTLAAFNCNDVRGGKLAVIVDLHLFSSLYSIFLSDSILLLALLLSLSCYSLSLSSRGR